MNFTGLVARTNAPSQIQVVFSLRDETGRAVVVPADEIERGLKVFESGEGTGGSWEEIDYGETGFFVHAAEKIDLEVVFVLDFTNGISEARLSDGGSGVEAMLDAFEASLALFPIAHRVGVVEFHDENAMPGVLSPLTTDKQAVRDSVREFRASGFVPGASRVWDSLATASAVFSSHKWYPGAVRAVVLVTDGRDAASDWTLDQAAQYARERGLRLYAVGVGDVFEEPKLRSVAHSTGGRYYSAHDVDLVRERLRQAVYELLGQHQLTYLTLRRAGEYRVRMVLEVEEIRGEVKLGPFDAARFFGAGDREIIEFDPPSLDRANRRSTVFMRARHVPGGIGRIRFRAQIPRLSRVELAPGRDGGLLEGWTLSGPDAGDWYEASGEALASGGLGLLAKLTFSDLMEDDQGILLDFDGVYTGGETLAGDIVRMERIAFTSGRAGHFEEHDICAMKADGSGVTRLVDNETVGFPSWSPDGRRIAFMSDRDGDDEEFEIYVMNADGSGVTRLTDNEAVDWLPSWSPDGRRIAFTSDLGGNPEIYVMNADGSGVIRLTDNEAVDLFPIWSPDGRRIAFTSDRDGDDEEYDIYVMNADGSGVTRLTDNEAVDWFPSWSPDGRRIAFASGRAGDDDSLEIYVMNADGSGVTRLTDNDVGDLLPIWSPDGRRIAFTSDRDWNLDVYVMNADGSGVTRLTDNETDNFALSWTTVDVSVTAAPPFTVPATVPAPIGEFASVSAGRRHTCGLRADGSVACWGDDSDGRSTPPGGQFTSVSVGGDHTCGLRAEGSVVCWGADQSTPPGGQLVFVSAGGAHTCGLRADGSVVCWGDNSYGRSTPPGGQFLSVSAGRAHTCGLRAEGSVVCWGADHRGQSTPPGGQFVFVSAGGDHTCGLRIAGSVVCWGDDSDGQSTPPVGQFVSISAGRWHTCGLRPYGSVACWGDDWDGQSTPARGQFASVGAGWDHTCGVRPDGSVVCWGDDSDGQSTPPG